MTEMKLEHLTWSFLTAPRMFRIRECILTDVSTLHRQTLLALIKYYVLIVNFYLHSLVHSINSIGYLSQLLKWNLEDPPDAEEVTRNRQVCSGEFFLR
jgi:hypothetical protein